ncbi:hypothetical protein DH2020_013699 [Rehmannia glutinosa]|uniref:Transmembrane protein n=1 Tax=Rehmannia glutinosa TaxID=99300 RepID=A0ABR0X6J2_REHGL
MAALASSLSSFRLSTAVFNSRHPNSSPLSGILLFNAKSYPNKQNFKQFRRRSLSVVAATEGSAKNPSKSKEDDDDNGGDPSVPSWAKPDSDELPPWARQEAQKDSSSFEIPFFVYLLASAITAIAAIGSIFEYVNQKPVFGVLNSDSVFYAPLLGFFVFTGIPSSAFLWFKSVQAANKEAEEQDRRDGYL